MRYVTNFGELYRLSEQAYRRMLRAIANDKPFSLDDEGKFLGEVVNVTDLEPTEANSLWREAVAEAKKKKGAQNGA